MPKDWSTEKRWWRCHECLILLRYAELVHATNGYTYCYECAFDLQKFFEDNGYSLHVSPQLCESCGEPLSQMEFSTTWRGSQELMHHCSACMSDLPPEALDELAIGLVDLLGVPDEQG